jgi:SAM-dependent methyltransferase
MRNRSFGIDSYNFFDFIGNKLSEVKFSKILPRNRDTILDLGCGYYAKLSQSVRKKFKTSVLLDVSINPDLNNSNELIIGDAHEVIFHVQDSSLDFCIANNVLEHLKQPDLVLATLKNKMKINSVIYICVPNWNGKKFLELGAFKLRFLSFEEMNDHKFYFSKKELWLLLLRSGFQPANISIKTIKFGLCTQAVIRLNLS